MRVLIVDDEPDILLMVRLNLEAEGHAVVMAADGEKALERIASDAPEVVVLDVMMPVLDGWGVLEALQGSAGAPPVLVVSAKTNGPDIRHAVTLGAAGYLTKPFDPDELVRAVAELVERTPAQRDEAREALLARVSGGSSR